MKNTNQNLTNELDLKKVEFEKVKVESKAVVKQFCDQLSTLKLDLDKANTLSQIPEHNLDRVSELETTIANQQNKIEQLCDKIDQLSAKNFAVLEDAT